ncbi:MAG: type II 3-dehydroquinate dehydratase [Alphaproteobacteria bacterium]
MIVNGPNLNLLGIREPEIYGRDTLDDIRLACESHGVTLGLEIDLRQSNSEGALIDWIQEARGACAGLIINPAAYTHSSVAIMDALQVLDAPVVELHLSNIFKREAFRHHSYVSPVAAGLICGFGAHGYILALDAMARLIETQERG